LRTCSILARPFGLCAYAMAAAAARRPCGECANFAILFISDIALTIPGAKP
jgi:hypothetical protein